MKFIDFISIVEATLLAEHKVKLPRGRFTAESAEWCAGALLLRLDVASNHSVALYMSLEAAIVEPVSYPMTLRSARDIAHDLAALIDLPAAGL